MAIQQSHCHVGQHSWKDFPGYWHMAVRAAPKKLFNFVKWQHSCKLLCKIRQLRLVVTDFFLRLMMAIQLVTKITSCVFEAENLLRLAAGNALRKASSQPQPQTLRGERGGGVRQWSQLGMWWEFVIYGTTEEPIGDHLLLSHFCFKRDITVNNVCEEEGKAHCGLFDLLLLLHPFKGGK